MTEPAPSTRLLASGEGLTHLLRALAARVDEAAAAAQHAGEAIRAEVEAHEAEWSSEPHGRDRRRMVAELAETVVTRISEIAHGYEELAETLAQSAERLAGAGEDPAIEDVDPRFGARPRAPADEGIQTSAGRISAGLRLLTTQMAAAGMSRAEIERRLEDELGVDAAPVVVDELLGKDFGAG